MRTLYFTILFLVASVLVFPQEVIKEKVNINPKITGGIIFDGCSYGFYDSTEVEVRFVPASISPGDTALMQLWIHAQDYEYEINDDQWDIIQRNITVDPSYGTVSKRSDGEYQFIALKNIPDSVTNMLINYETYSAACIILGKFSNPNNLSAVTDSVGKSVKILAKLNGTNGCIDCGYSPSGLLRLYGSGVIQLNTEKLVAYLDRDTLSPGDTANILIKSVDASGNTKDYPDTTQFEIGVINGCGLGNILDSNGNTKEYFGSVMLPLKFVVNPQADVDTATIVLRVGAPTLNAANSSVRAKMLRKTPIMKISALAAKIGLAEMVIKKVANATDYSYCIPEGNFQVSNFTTTQSKFINQKTILLGESKYYYVTNDNGKLTINETTDPSSNPGLSNATFDNPVAAKGSEKNPVYWEYKYPVFTKKVYENMTSLPDGMIRLVGRYWEEGKTYKASLTAHYGSTSNTVEIEVKRPKSLGTLYGKSKDVFNKPISIDSICISYGGQYGIPPQYIKGQVATEGVYVSGLGYAPSYRYEPFSKQFEGRKRGDKADSWSSSPFYTTKTSMGIGDPVPDHANVKYINYPKEPPIMVWDMVKKYSELTSESPPGGVTLYGLRNSDGTMNFKKYGYTTIQGIYDNYLKMLTGDKTKPSKEDISSALDSTVNYLRDKWNGGLNNVVAQTRIASSYGLIQMTYTLALSRKYSEGAHNPPELLNVNSTLFPLSMKDQLLKLQKQIGSTLDQSGEWKNGFDESLKGMYKAWNPWMTGYSDKVFINSQNFLPLQ